MYEIKPLEWEEKSSDCETIHSAKCIVGEFSACEPDEADGSPYLNVELSSEVFAIPCLSLGHAKRLADAWYRVTMEEFLTPTEGQHGTQQGRTGSNDPQ